MDYFFVLYIFVVILVYNGFFFYLLYICVTLFVLYIYIYIYIYIFETYCHIVTVINTKQVIGHHILKNIPVQN